MRYFRGIFIFLFKVVNQIKLRELWLFLYLTAWYEVGSRVIVNSLILTCDFQGHTQQEHETSHGSMTQTRWAVDGPDDVKLELGGRKFSSNDEGAPMMCNLVCSSMGRHVHIDYCRAEANGSCYGAEVQHVNSRMVPDPDRPKDAVTHSLYWRRMGLLRAVLPEVRPELKYHLLLQASKVIDSRFPRFCQC